MVSATLNKAGSLECWAVPNNAGSGFEPRSASATASTGAPNGLDYPVSVTLTGLAASTEYDIYCVARDVLLIAAPTQSILEFRTRDLTAPAVAVGGALTVTTATGTAASLAVTYNELALVYCVAVLNGTWAPAAPGSVRTAALANLADPIKAKFVSSGTVAANAAVVVSFTGLSPATLYTVYCVAEDTAAPKRRSVGALDGNVGGLQQGSLFSQGCTAQNATVPVVTFRNLLSSVQGDNLVLRWDSSRHYYTHGFRFALASNNGLQCDLGTTATGSAVSSPWQYQPSPTSCLDTWIFNASLTSTLAACGFVATVNDAAAIQWQGTVDATTVENATTTVFSTGLNFTRTAATVFAVRLDKVVTANVSAVVYPSAIVFASVTTQTVDTASGNNLTLTLATSVQYPYELVPAGASTVTAPSQVSAVAGAAAQNLCAGEGECLQTHVIGLRPSVGTCALDTGVQTTFTIRCRSDFSGSCVPPVPGTATVSFTVRTDDFCARVVEVAQVTARLRSYGDTVSRDNADAAPTPASEVTSGVLNGITYMRLDVAAEAGVAIDSVTLLDVSIVSACVECKNTTVVMSNGVLATTPNPVTAYQWAMGLADGGRRDFEFANNDDSMSFNYDAAGGQIGVSVRVGAIVNFTTPSGQKASKRVDGVLAASSGAPSPVAVRAQAQFGMTSESSAASSSASSTVSTVAVVAVGGAVVAAIAVGAIVVGRRRAARRLASSKSSAGSAPAAGHGESELATASSASRLFGSTAGTAGSTLETGAAGEEGDVQAVASAPIVVTVGGVQVQCTLEELQAAYDVEFV